ncbi:hypothetical protein Ancab_032735 [Ancistrocladus abbreviatus]
MASQKVLIVGSVFLCVLALSNPLDVEDGELCAVGFDYRDALRKAILFFEGQRSGKLPAAQRVEWRGDSALNDGKLENVNLIGGYYDAGDNVKFGWPMSFTVSLLSWAAVEYQKELSSVKQFGQLRVGDGSSDHNCWERPEDMDTPRTLYKITSSQPGTEAAAESAAALAAASIVYKGVQSNYSTRLLHQAESLFEFADKYRGSYQGSCPFYCSYSGYQDELLWAAAWLYKASGASRYLKYVSSNQGWSSAVSEFSWDLKYAGAQVLLAKEFFAGKQKLKKFKSDADSFVCAVMPASSSKKLQTTPGSKSAGRIMPSYFANTY